MAEPEFEYHDILPTRKKNPWVAVGALATAGVLVGGLLAFKQGNAKVSQAMMRWRVVAQGATVAIMMGSWAAMIMEDKQQKAAAEAAAGQQSALAAASK